MVKKTKDFITLTQKRLLKVPFTTIMLKTHL